MYDARWIDVGQSMFAFFHQVLRVPDPVARFAGAGSFIMSQVFVQRFDQSYAFAQGNTQGFIGLQAQLLEVLHAMVPTAIA